MFARWFRSFALKHALVAIASFLANGWTKHKDAISKWLSELDDKFEARTGLNIPDAWQAWYDQMVQTMVGRVDEKAKTRDFWRLVLDTVQNLDDPKKRDRLLDEIATLNIAEAVTSQMSTDLAAIYNSVKHNLAARFIKASVAKNPPPAPLTDAEGKQIEPAMVRPSDEQIDEHIKTAAAIQPALHSGEPVTPELMETLIQESKARKAKLQGK